MNIDNIIQFRIERVVNSICEFSDAIVLYGSQSKVCSLNSDIDLLVLTDKRNNKNIYEKISDLQVEFLQIIHAVMISEKDLEINLDLNEIFKNGTLVWKNRQLTRRIQPTQGSRG